MPPKITITDFVNQTWDQSIVPTLKEYITIPNKSPAFDPQWESHGYMEKAVALLVKWCHAQAIAGMQLEVLRLPSRTPVIWIEIPGQATERTVLLYGHMDKQPEMTGWDEGLGPWKPVQKGDLLYGRGGADDGYSTFAAVTAIKALQMQNIPHGRCVILIEGCEESGSFDLPYYIEAQQQRIGIPELVICLDSGCGNYEQLWLTTSLRGLITGTLTVRVLREGIHSGFASGLVPSSFRIIRQLLSRIEDEKTGEMRVPETFVKIPDWHQQKATETANVLNTQVATSYPFLTGVLPTTDSVAEQLLNRTWRPALGVTGAEGLPDIEHAGNVLRPATTLKLSLRLPPTCDASKAAEALKRALEAAPPYGARVGFEIQDAMSGWVAPPVADWLANACNQASQLYFNGQSAAYIGEGGSIPFMGMLGEKFPNAQFMITGVLGPHSNAHGPNEFLHIPTGKNVTACVAHVVAQHFLS